MIRLPASNDYTRLNDSTGGVGVGWARDWRRLLVAHRLTRTRVEMSLMNDGEGAVGQSSPEHSRHGEQGEPRAGPLVVGREGDLEMAREVLSRLDRDGYLAGARQRSKRLAVIGIGGAIAAFTLPFEGLTATILGLWAYVGFGIGGLGLVLWLAINEFRAGGFERQGFDDGSEAVVDREVLITSFGALLLAWFVRATRQSAGARVLWSVLLGEESLPVVDAVADERHDVDADAVRKYNRLLSRAVQVSVAVVSLDLFLRHAPTDAIISYLATGGQAPTPAFGAPSVPAIGILESLSTPEWVAIFIGLLVLGGVVGLGLAVTLKR